MEFHPSTLPLQVKTVPAQFRFMLFLLLSSEAKNSILYSELMP